METDGALFLEQAHFAELDDIFLTMEGMGQWLIYRYFRSPEGGSVPVAQALAATRRGGRWWGRRSPSRPPCRG